MRYNYSIVVSSDIGSEAVVKEMVDVCQIACEKHAAAEKSPAERNNMAAANMIKVRQGLTWQALQAYPSRCHLGCVPRLCLFCSAHGESSLRAGKNKHNLSDNGMDTPVNSSDTVE